MCQGEGDQKESVLDYQFSTHDLVCLGLCSTVGVWYIMKKHWIANNLLGMAFAINGVELLHLNNVVTGCILLGGLFFYDIFWVFGTDVMVTVAKSFEAPIKLVFPQVRQDNIKSTVKQRNKNYVRKHIKIEKRIHNRLNIGSVGEWTERQ